MQHEPATETDRPRSRVSGKKVADCHTRAQNAFTGGQLRELFFFTEKLYTKYNEKNHNRIK